MAKPYRVTAYVRLSNAINASLVRLGIPMGSTLLRQPFADAKVASRSRRRSPSLSRKGNATSLPRTRVVNRVRNLRAAAGVATLTRGRRTEKIHALELEPESAALVFREAVHTGPPAFPPCSFACTSVSPSAVT
jgi:hypothetical protein